MVSCGTDGNRDQCNRWTDPDDEFPGFLWLYSDSSIFGGHGNVWGAVGNDKGTDRYRIALENDWVLEAFHWRVSVDPGEGFAFEPSGFTKAPTWSPSVTWNVSPDDRVFYAAVVTIAGPVGVPHK